MKNDHDSVGLLVRNHEPIVTRLMSVFIIAGSVVFMIVACLISTHLILRHYAHKRPMQPMRSLGILTAPDTRALTHLPAPNLELDDGHGNFVALRGQQIQKLNSYGWIDRSTGIARIPIDRAMDLVVARGLPVATNRESATGSLQLQEKTLP